MRLIRKITLTAALLALPCALASAQAGPYRDSPDEARIRFAYSIALDTYFDNMEYDKSGFADSGTIFGSRMNAFAGLTTIGENSRHTLLVGIETNRDFGSGSSSSHRINFNYSFIYRQGLRRYEVYAGVFPRAWQKIDWSTAFYSERKLWYDPNMEGLLVRYEDPYTSAVLGCDWTGMFGSTATTREEFTVFSALDYKPWSHVGFGYHAYMTHYANSTVSYGVVDNILAEPYVKVDLDRVLIRKLNFRIGYIQSLQRDRNVTHDFLTPGLVELTSNAQVWRIGIDNRLYVGSNIIPYYNSSDASGNIYGSSLYDSDPFFSIREDGSDRAGFYDRLELYWTPFYSRHFKLKVSSVFHFHNGSFSGSQQMVSIKYELTNLKKL